MDAMKSRTKTAAYISDAGAEARDDADAGIFALVPAPGTPVTGAWSIATEAELNDNPYIAAALRRMAAAVPMLRTFVAKRLTACADASIPVTPRVAYFLRSHERHSHFDMNTLGAVGCADSHVRVLRAIDAQVQRGEVCANGWSLVCESDAKIDRKGWAAFSRSQARVDDAADVCMLVLGYMPGFDEGMPVSGRHGAFWNCATKPWQGTYALLVRNKHAGKIADAVLPLDCHYDAALAFAAMAGRIPPIWLASVPIVVEDRERNRSTVQSNKLELKTRLPASDVACSALVITPYVIAMALLITVLCMCIAQAASKRKRQQTVNTPR